MREVADAHIAAIRSDALAAVTLVETSRSAEQRRLEAIELLLADGPPEGASADSVGSLLFWGLYTFAQRSDIPFDAYDDLVNAGELQLISDPQLRSELSRLERMRTEMEVDLENFATIHLHLFDPLIHSTFDMESISGPGDGQPLPFTQWDTLSSREVRNLLVEKRGWSRSMLSRLDELGAQFETVGRSADSGP